METGKWLHNHLEWNYMQCFEWRLQIQRKVKWQLCCWENSRREIGKIRELLNLLQNPRKNIKNEILQENWFFLQWRGFSKGKLNFPRFLNAMGFKGLRNMGIPEENIPATNNTNMAKIGFMSLWLIILSVDEWYKYEMWNLFFRI